MTRPIPRSTVRVGKWLPWLVPVTLLAGGCRTRLPRPNELERGAVWIFPGIEGTGVYVAPARRAFRDSGIDAALFTRAWDHHWFFLSNLTDYHGNRAAAERTAQDVTEYCEAYPGRPVDLVGYSGGGGMALMVAEALPEGVRIRNVVLVHAAISRDYNLSGALTHVDGRLVNLHSGSDWLILGLGTRLFGTMDRRHAASAGMTGLDLETAAPCHAGRAKVVQRAWSLSDMRKGYWGGHLGIKLYTFNRNVVAPYLRQ